MVLCPSCHDFALDSIQRVLVFDFGPYVLELRGVRSEIADQHIHGDSSCVTTALPYVIFPFMRMRSAHLEIELPFADLHFVFLWTPAEVSLILFFFHDSFLSLFLCGDLWIQFVGVGICVCLLIDRLQIHFFKLSISRMGIICL